MIAARGEVLEPAELRAEMKQEIKWYGKGLLATTPRGGHEP